MSSSPGNNVFDLANDADVARPEAMSGPVRSVAEFAEKRIPTHRPHWLTLSNPIGLKAMRARMRIKHTVSWGAITVTITSFIVLLMYLIATERKIADPADAARTLFLPLIVIQGIILMLLGTGAVAGGLSQERDGGLVDYHRMTPMSPSGKILGYLFGLPAREYFLFALTLPFIAFAVVRSGFSIFTLLHFYVVFFSSVLVYHMTGLVVGMTASKPRRAAMITQGFVLLLYFVLPQLKFLGLTFFEYLTIRPTLIGMVMEEIERSSSIVDDLAAERYADFMQYDQVGFFNLLLHPTVYTLVVQFFLLLTMFIIVRRKWIDQNAHIFSKTDGLFFFLGCLALTVGSVWPFISQNEVLRALQDQYGDAPTSYVLFGLLVTVIILLGALTILAIHFTTPDRFTIANGIRRMRKLNLAKIPYASDAASSRMMTAAILTLGLIGTALLVYEAARAGEFLSAWPPMWMWSALIVYTLCILLFAQGVRERFSTRVFLVSLFMLWMLPAFTATILMAAFREYTLGCYVGMPFPPFGIVLILAHIFQNAEPLMPGMEHEFVPSMIREDVPRIIAFGCVLYAALAVGVQIHLHRWRRQITQRELQVVPIG